LSSGWKAKESNDSGIVFNQLINDIKKSPEEIVIYTDGSKTKVDDFEKGSSLVGCAILTAH